MTKLLFKTGCNWIGTMVRIILGLIMFPLGAQQLPGWFGGDGFTSTMDYFTHTVGLPWSLAFMVIMLEFFGSILLILGLGTRVLGSLFFILILGIILTHSKHGFFLSWFGSQAGASMQYFMLASWMALSAAVIGGGSLSVDRLITHVIQDRKHT